MSASIEYIRKQATALTNRISNDAAFRAQVKNDPEATLVAAGLPAEAVPDFLSEERTGDVSGYMTGNCTFTCILTGCSLSIF